MKVCLKLYIHIFMLHSSLFQREYALKQTRNYVKMSALLCTDGSF